MKLVGIALVALGVIDFLYVTLTLFTQIPLLVPQVVVFGKDLLPWIFGGLGGVIIVAINEKEKVSANKQGNPPRK